MEEFIAQIVDYLELDIVVSEDDVFRDWADWDSLAALSLIALAHDKYKVNLTADDLKSCIKVRDVYEKILEKAQNK